MTVNLEIKGKQVKELTIISGKGGTGKTSIVASFAALSKNKVIVDADVDAADLHLVVSPETVKTEDFKGGSTAWINPELCTQCGDCIDRCRFDAISDDFVVDRIACEGCSVCASFCPAGAIEFNQRVCGQWFESNTKHGPMIHAKLGIAEENSGLLVSLLRKEARELAKSRGLGMVMLDGPPGIGCPVIASVTGTDSVLIITEPTLSGMHDMERVKGLADFLKVQTLLCVNKYDLNPQIAEQMEVFARENGMGFVGSIPYDRDVTESMIAGMSTVEFSDGPAARAIRGIWEKIEASVLEKPEKFVMA